MTPTRRQVTIGLGAAMLPLPARAQSAGFRETLDRAAIAPPADALRLIEGLAPSTPSERLDLETARDGLQAELELAGTTGTARFALLLRRAVGVVDLRATRARIQREQALVLARADGALRGIGLTKGSVGARYSQLWHDERFLYPDDDAGRDRAVADMNRTLAATRPRLPAWFDALPPETSRAGTRRMAREDEAKGRQGYREIPSPGTIGGYVVDLKDIRRRPCWTLPSVVHHELLPGHLVQTPAETKGAQHPLRLRYTPAFGEGWAIYAETLAADPTDQMAEVGHLHWLLFRLNRACVDLGIHLEGWSMTTAREWMGAWQGEPAYFAPFDIDLPRIAAEPAARTAEAVMWLAIADLARGKRGPALRRFHTAVLTDGRKRLTALRRATTR